MFSFLKSVNDILQQMHCIAILISFTLMLFLSKAVQSELHRKCFPQIKVHVSLSVSLLEFQVSCLVLARACNVPPSHVNEINTCINMKVNI